MWRRYVAHLHRHQCWEWHWWMRTGTQSAEPSTRVSRGGMGELAQQVLGNEQGSQRSPPEWKEQGQHSVESQRGQGEGRCIFRSDQREEDSEPRCGSGQAPAEFQRRLWMKLCEAWRHGTTPTLRQQAEAGLERLLLLSRRVYIVEISCLCSTMRCLSVSPELRKCGCFLLLSQCAATVAWCSFSRQG